MLHYPSSRTTSHPFCSNITTATVRGSLPVLQGLESSSNCSNVWILDSLLSFLDSQWSCLMSHFWILDSCLDECISMPDWKWIDIQRTYHDSIDKSREHHQLTLQPERMVGSSRNVWPWEPMVPWWIVHLLVGSAKSNTQTPWKVG